MKNQISSAINMRKIRNLADVKSAINIVSGYIITEAEDPKKSNRSDYLAIRKWLNNIATIHGYSSLRDKSRELSKSIELILKKANHITLKRTQKNHIN